MKAFDIVGYVKDGACFCTDHKPEVDDEEVGVVFAVEEGVEDMTCDECHEHLVED